MVGYKGKGYAEGKEKGKDRLTTESFPYSVSSFFLFVCLIFLFPTFIHRKHKGLISKFILR